MKLYTDCPFCKKENNIKAFVKDRDELLKLKGETVEINCKHCGSSFHTQIDNVYAKSSKLPIIVALSLPILAAPFIFISIRTFLKDANFFVISFGIIAIPSIIYQIMNNKDKNRIKRFNGFKVRK